RMFAGDFCEFVWTKIVFDGDRVHAPAKNVFAGGGIEGDAVPAAGALWGGLFGTVRGGGDRVEAGAPAAVADAAGDCGIRGVPIGEGNLVSERDCDVRNRRWLGTFGGSSPEGPGAEFERNLAQPHFRGCGCFGAADAVVSAKRRFKRLDCDASGGVLSGSVGGIHRKASFARSALQRFHLGRVFDLA